MNEKRARRHAMKREPAITGDAYDVGKQMSGACGLLMVLMPIGLIFSLLYVALTQP